MVTVAFFWHPAGQEAARQTLAALAAWSRPAAPAPLLILPARLPDLAHWRQMADQALPGWRISVCELPDQADATDRQAAGWLAAAHALARGAGLVVALPGDATPLPNKEGLAAAPVIDGRHLDPAEILARVDRALADLPPPARELPRAQAGSGAPLPRLAYVSPMPPERSGIADYSARLVQGLAAHFAIDIYCAEPEQVPPAIGERFACRTYAELPARQQDYDRVVYHMGNSHFHLGMWPLFQTVPGVMVLHDVFLGGAVHAREGNGEIGIVFDQLLHGYGVAGLDAHFQTGQDAAINRFPLNAGVLPLVDGIIVHSAHAAELVERWFRHNPLPIRIAPIGFGAHPRDPAARAAARERLGLSADDCLVCSFGFLGATKQNDKLLAAWQAAELHRDEQAHLVFVGAAGGDYGAALVTACEAPELAGRVRITGYTEAATYQDYLLAADFAVQLRRDSRGESSATILDCLAHGVPALINAHGSAAELPTTTVVALADDFALADLAAGLQTLRGDPALRQRLGLAALDWVGRELNAATVAEKHARALLDLTGPGQTRLENALCARLAGLLPAKAAEVAEVADAVAAPVDEPRVQQWAALAVRNRPAPHAPRLLLELTGIGETDLRTGIERSTRNLTRALLHVDRPDLWPEPVRREMTPDGPRLWRSSRYMAKLCGWPDIFRDLPLRIEEGDFLMMIDTSWGYYRDFAPIYEELRQRGGRVAFFIHDLLPLQLPECFPPELPDMFTGWMDFVVAQADAVVCGSRTSADAVIAYAEERRHLRQRPFHVGFSHYGADIRQDLAEATPIRDELQALADNGTTLFLTVGTLEPRKGHVTILDAFEQAWAAGENVSLCIIGKQGWMMEPLAERIRQHPEWEQRLLWVAGASDSELDFAYRQARAVICASRAEGFGLPIIEAAQYGKPVILSDIPIFREVAGEGAAYFEMGNPSALAAVLAAWSREIPALPAIPWVTWQQSAEKLAHLLLDGAWYRTLAPEAGPA